MNLKAICLSLTLALSSNLYSANGICKDIATADNTKTLVAAQIAKHGLSLKTKAQLTAILIDGLTLKSKAERLITQGNLPSRAEAPLSKEELRILGAIAMLEQKGYLEPALKKALAHPAAQSKLEGIDPKLIEVMLPQLTKAIRDQLQLFGMIGEPKPLKTWNEIAKNFETNLTKYNSLLKNSRVRTVEAIKEALLTTYGVEFKNAEYSELLIDGPASFKNKADIIDSARKSIHIYSWSIYDDFTGRLFADKLIQKASQGIPVRIIVDGNVSKKPKHNKIVKELKNSKNIELIEQVIPQNPLFGMHRKAVIVDGEKMNAGGTNFGDYYSWMNNSKLKWRDTDIYLKGDVVVSADRDFVANFNTLSGKNIKSVGKYTNSQVRAKNHAFVSQKAGESNVYEVNLALMEAAEHRIEISNAYVIFTPAFKAVIERAIKRGVEVIVHTNSNKSVDEPVVSVPILKTAKELKQMGAKVYLKEGDTLHSKYMVIDNSIGVITSLNLHPRSIRIEAEDAIISTDAFIVSRMSRMFKMDMDTATEIKDANEIQVPYNIPAILGLRVFFDQL